MTTLISPLEQEGEEWMDNEALLYTKPAQGVVAQRLSVVRCMSGSACFFVEDNRTDISSNGPGSNILCPSLQFLPGREQRWR